MADKPDHKASGGMLILGVAIANDVLDWFGADLALFRLLDLAAGGVIGWWMFTNKGVKKTDPTMRFVSSAITEAIPIIGDISPTWTIAVIITLYKMHYTKTETAVNALLKLKK